MDPKRAWSGLAAWYDRKQGDTGDLWHRALIDPALVEVLGPVRGLDLLDLGCGNGYLCRRYAREGAHVTGVDASPPVVELARSRQRSGAPSVRYLVGDAAHLVDLDDGVFDVVTSNMALMDIADGAAAIREVARVLRPGGRFVFSISHPCFDIMSRSAWVVEHQRREATVWRKVTRYRDLYEEAVPWYVTDTEVRTTPGYHRPLSWYFRELGASGFCVEQLVEPAPLEELLRESPQGRYIAEIPLHLVLGAFKSGNAAPDARARPPSRRRPGRRGRGKAPR